MSANISSRLNVKVVDERFGRTTALPDESVLITLADGREFIVDGERLKPQGDGTYLVAITDVDRIQLSRSQPADLHDASTGKRYV